ncbi:MAG: adenosine deaminase [Rubrivivax sp.]|nr:adenosine deaminase [Rubrivivax sp.]
MSTLPASFFRELPKVELHCHLLGTVQRATLGEWVRREKAPISDAEIEAFYTRGDKPVGVLRVFRALEQQLMRHADDLARLTREYLGAAAAHNVRHAEFFWNPTGAVRDSRIAYADGLAAIAAAMRAAEREHGITSRLIAAIDREGTPREAREMVQWVVAHLRGHEGVVAGIGIDYRETDRPPELFTEAYVLARRHGLKATAHAGEFGCAWTNVRTAVEVLKVDRIDHGYTVVDAALGRTGATDAAASASAPVNEAAAARAFIDRCRERGIVFTVVPTNSYYLRTLPKERWALDHPIRAMPGLGIAIHPNSDDPALHRVTPTEAWQKMHAAFGFGVEDLRAFMCHGIAAAWVDEATRQRWSAGFEREFERICSPGGFPSPDPAASAGRC